MRILNLADGYSSATEPVVTPIESNNLVSFISDSAYVTANPGSPVGGNVYYNTTTGKIRYYNGVSMQWETIGEQVVFIQEPIGTGNGSQVTFIVSNAPINDEALHIYVNGQLIPKADYTISLPNVTLDTAPAAGQKVYASYLSNGSPASPIVSVGTNNVLYYEIQPADVTAKAFTLPSTPAEQTKLLVDFLGVGSLEFGVDFNVTGSDIEWNGLTLDGFIASSDILRIQYFN